MVYEHRLEHIPPRGKNSQDEKAKQEPENASHIEEEEEMPPGDEESQQNVDQPEEDMIVDQTDEIPEEGQ
jgi:hypothetical protein